MDLYLAKDRHMRHIRHRKQSDTDDLVEELSYSAWINVTDDNVRLILSFDGFDDEMSAQIFMEGLVGADDASEAIH